MSDKYPIKLIVFDIDGVLTDGETKALDLDLLSDLAQMNQHARREPSGVAVTLCTGRPAQYVELMLQAIDGHLPGIFENGAGLYVPETYRFLPNPTLSDGAVISAVRRRLEETIVSTGEAYFQPGKEYSITLFPNDPDNIGKLLVQTADVLGDLHLKVDLVYSTSCLNILPKGIDKGNGIRFLSDRTGYRPEEMLGVGDSDVDLQFLSLVGHSAAPVNANPEIKKAVEYVSPFRTSHGVRDILEHFDISLER